MTQYLISVWHAPESDETPVFESDEQMQQAFAQTAEEAAQNPNAAPPPGPPGNNQPQRRPTFELLEVQMLRMLHADLNELTRLYPEQLTAQPDPGWGTPA